MVETESLSTSQEEADTRMILFVKHSLKYFQENIIINSLYSDVSILSLMVSKKIGVNTHCKAGQKIKANIININKVKQSMKSTHSPVVEVGLERFTKVLISIHAFTSSDTVSAIAGLGKTKAFRKTTKNIEYIKIFEKLGEEWHLDEEMLEV